MAQTDIQILESSAYHEAGHIVFAYLNGFIVTQSRLSEATGDGGVTQFDGGSDNSLIQIILTKGYNSVPPDKKDVSAELAMKLMSIYCAGSCTQLFYENGKTFPEGNLDISGLDLRRIETLQSFLKAADKSFPDDYPSRVMKIIFEKLRDEEVSGAVEELAKMALKEDNHKLNRFNIEDGLAASGFKRSSSSPPSKTKKDIGINIQEVNIKDEDADNSEIIKHKPESPLDIILKDYLENIKQDWKTGEIDKAAEDIKAIFKKYGV